MAAFGGEDHPYDTPYARMLEMRRDIQDLKGMLLAEQQQRASEVSELRNEVLLLREAVKHESRKREATCTMMMKELAPVSQTTEFDSLRVAMRKQLHDLEHQLHDEVRDRRAGDSLRDTRDEAHKSDISSRFNHVHKDIGSHKQHFGCVKEDHKSTLNNCVHDIHLLAGSMQRIMQSWGSMQYSSLETSGMNGGGGRAGKV